MHIYDYHKHFYSREYCFMGGDDPKRILMRILRTIDRYTTRITDFSEKECVYLDLDNCKIIYCKDLIAKNKMISKYIRPLSIHRYKVRYTMLRTTLHGEEHVIKDLDFDMKSKTLKIKLGFRLFRYKNSRF